MENEFNRKIGNEIRRVQDEVRSSVNEAKEKAAQEVQQAKDQAYNYYQEKKRFLTQNIKNQINDAVKSTLGDKADFDVDEFTKEVQERADLEALASTQIKENPFPYVMFYIALVLDVLDIADFTGIGWVVMVIVEIVFSIIMYFWMKGKISKMFRQASRGNRFTGGEGIFRGKRVAGSRKREQSIAQRQLKKFSEKYLEKYASRRLLATVATNIIPIIGILSSMAFFVFLAWKRQNKLVRIYMATVEKAGEILNRVREAEESEASESAT